MTPLPWIAEAEALPGYRLRLRHYDGAAGVVDLSGTVAAGGTYAALGGARFGGSP